MARCVLYLLAPVSLAMCLALAGLWVRSYFVADRRAKEGGGRNWRGRAGGFLVRMSPHRSGFG